MQTQRLNVLRRPPGLKSSLRKRRGKRYLFALNHMPEPAEIPLEGRYTELLSRRTAEQKWILEGYGVAILQAED